MAFDFKRHLIKVQGGRPTCRSRRASSGSGKNTPTGASRRKPSRSTTRSSTQSSGARICDGDGKLMATGTKKEDVKGFGDFIEKAETGSVGRALALCGFGTQFAPELDEAGGGRFADSPQPMGGGRFGGGGGSYGGGGNYGGGSNGGGSNRYGGPPPSGNGEGVRFIPPREAAPREMSTPAERPAPSRDGGGGQARPEAPRNNDVPRSEAARPEPTRPSPVDDAGEDDFEALIGGEGLLDATEDDPFGDDADAAPKPSVGATRSSAPAKPEATGTPACVGCGKALTKAQQELSIRNYGEALCPAASETRRAGLL